MVCKTDRRTFIGLGGKLLAGGLAATALIGSKTAMAADASPSIVVDSATEEICATCQYWGGIRKVSPDKSKVAAQSLGWCNNTTSVHFQHTTTPTTGPMKAWKKWDALS